MNVKKYGLVDLETGEVFGATIYPWKENLGGKWVRLFQNTLKQLRQKKRLRGESFYVLSYLLEEVDWQNRVPGTAKVAHALNMKQAGVNRAFRELKEVGYLVVKDKTVYLNPLLCWKGSNKQYHQFCEELFSARQEALPDSSTGGIVSEHDET